MKKEIAFQKGLESMQSFATSHGFNQGMTIPKAQDMLHNMDALKASSLTGDELTARMEALQGGVGSNHAHALENIAATRDSINAASVAQGGSPMTVTSQSGKISSTLGSLRGKAEVNHQTAQTRAASGIVDATTAVNESDLAGVANQQRFNKAGVTSSRYVNQIPK